MILLGAALPHVEVSSVLVAFLERHHGPVLAVFHQLLEGHLDTPDEVILGVPVLIEDLQLDRELVVPVAEL